MQLYKFSAFVKTYGNLQAEGYEGSLKGQPFVNSTNWSFDLVKY